MIYIHFAQNVSFGTYSVEFKISRNIMSIINFYYFFFLVYFSSNNICHLRIFVEWFHKRIANMIVFIVFSYTCQNITVNCLFLNIYIPSFCMKTEFTICIKSWNNCCNIGCQFIVIIITIHTNYFTNSFPHPSKWQPFLHTNWDFSYNIIFFIYFGDVYFYIYIFCKF